MGRAQATSGSLPPPPFVSVVIPHYEDLQRLRLCLAALCAQTYPADRFEVIVADNASPVGLAAVLEAVAGRAKVVVVTDPGAGSARNGGAALARGEVLAFTDADCVPGQTWLEAGVLALRDADFVGGRVEVTIEVPGRPTPTEAFEQVFAFDNARYVNRLGFTVTANLFCWRRVFAAVGGFRVGVPEDLDWCVRASGEGFSLSYADEAAVGHPARRTWSELTRKWRRLNVEAYGLMAGRSGGAMRWLIRSLLLPVSAIVHTPKVLASRDLEGSAQKWSALMILYRLRFWRTKNALALLAAEKGR